MIPIVTSSACERSPSAPSSSAISDRGGEQPDADVDPGGGGGERAGEGDVAERVAGEHLRAEHDEVADQAARERDRGAGQPGVADELVREHHARRLDGAGAAVQQGGMVDRRAREPGDHVDGERDRGDVEPDRDSCRSRRARARPR